MKILVSDLDGTLFRDNIICDNDLKSLATLKDNGHKFIVATGRTLEGVRILSEKFNFEYDYLVLCNGSIVMNSSHEIIYKKSIDNSIALSIIKDYIDCEDLYIYLDTGTESYVPVNKYDKKLVAEFADNIKVLNNEKIFRLNCDFQILCFNSISNSIERVEAIKTEIISKYGDLVEVYRNTHFLDIVPKNCSKGDGLNHILNEIGVNTTNVYTIGDSFNDLPMFEITDNSYTFHHVDDLIKANANNHVHYVHECVDHIIKSS
ncbi:hypothetical protein SAMN02745163_00297 [Clostridium cavendishii DSM 21758]|uniref:Cof subfamily of IIB subfamily of haloacid dehalogenase superfamily/HAD-superfamily hydrolase, subfamily IIB n=1 Tax=Clostridium cavendishii DSM 21758 TaxID=1121302 RepID=A0A1M6BAP9_9CLOT|nr:HAD-IIB family hydrolase [Clostridium cavendishii]SHI45648.1 hypothetical protein SAMN02745163_00297 [Clostridium cavendishii DSM 21758]